MLDPVSVLVPYLKYDRQYQFKVEYVAWKQCWVCECNSVYKTGMPCSHLIKVIRKFEGSIGYYINERWFHAKQVDGDNLRISRPPIAKNRRRI